MLWVDILPPGSSETWIWPPEFLYRAWEKVPKKYIWGLPASLSVPRALAAKELFASLGALGVQAGLPPSGFAAGVRVAFRGEAIAVWEIKKRLD